MSTRYSPRCCGYCFGQGRQACDDSDPGCWYSDAKLDQVIRNGGRFIRLIPGNHVPADVAAKCPIIWLAYDNGYYRTASSEERGTQSAFKARDVTGSRS